MLVVVGRGASDPDANSNVAKVMRMLWEGMGFGWGETAYSGVTFPLVQPALDHAAKLGYRRIVVFPYFLFTGVLVQAASTSHTDAVAAAASGDRVHQGALSRTIMRLVIDTMVERVSTRSVEGDQQHELPDVQVSRTGSGVRGGSGAGAGKPPSSRRGGRRRAGELSVQWPIAMRGAVIEAFCKEHGLPWTHGAHAHDHSHSHAPRS
ncbi:MAG: CbiX/SirB N-terminal domain-containing protein [Hyphomicrobiales bacterium]